LEFLVGTVGFRLTGRWLADGVGTGGRSVVRVPRPSALEDCPKRPIEGAQAAQNRAGGALFGAEIVALDGTFGTVESVTVVADAQPMYNLTMDTANTFFVGDGQWLVHNTNFNCGSRPWQYTDNAPNRLHPDTPTTNGIDSPNNRLARSHSVARRNHPLSGDLADKYLITGNRIKFKGVNLASHGIIP
jgi:hypothetical protein